MRTKTVLAMIILVAASAAAIATAENEAEAVGRFIGSYDWSDGGSDDLSAVFTPDGDGNWKVEFTFRFSGKKNVWKGDATGSLDEGGKLSGTSGWGNRSWEFEAKLKDGVLVGNHTEIRRGGSRYNTGTFELRR